MGEANNEEMNHILVAPTLGSTASKVIAKGFGGPPEKSIFYWKSVSFLASPKTSTDQYATISNSKRPVNLTIRRNCLKSISINHLSKTTRYSISFLSKREIHTVNKLVMALPRL